MMGKLNEKQQEVLSALLLVLDDHRVKQTQARRIATSHRTVGCCCCHLTFAPVPVLPYVFFSNVYSPRVSHF